MALMYIIIHPYGDSQSYCYRRGPLSSRSIEPSLLWNMVLDYWSKVVLFYAALSTTNFEIKQLYL